MRLRSALFAVGLMTAIPAAAQTAMPPAMPVGWSAQAKGLEEITNRLRLPCSVNRIAARMKLSNPEQRPQMMPATGLDLVAAGAARETVMVRLEDDGAGKLVLVLRKYGGPKPIDDIRFPLSIAYGQEVPVVLGWSADGDVTVTAGGRQNRMKLGAPPAAVEFFVQGDVSEAKFDWQGPAKPNCPTAQKE